MRLEDEVGLAGDPNAIRDEMVRKDGGIQLVVGLVRLSLVDVGQRFPVHRAAALRQWGDLRDGNLSLGCVGKRRLCRQSRQAKQHGSRSTAKGASKLREGIRTSVEVN